MGDSVQAESAHCLLGRPVRLAAEHHPASAAAAAAVNSMSYSPPVKGR